MKFFEMKEEKEMDPKQNVAVAVMGTAAIVMLGQVVLILNDVSDKVYATIPYIPY